MDGNLDRLRVLLNKKAAAKDLIAISNDMDSYTLAEGEPTCTINK